MPEHPVFALHNVSKTFDGVAALVDVSLQVWAGEQVAVVGPSGAGKSTLIGLLNGTLAPTRGQVFALGHDLGALQGRARRRLQYQVGTVYQRFHLVDNLRVIHNINAGHLGRWSLARALFSLLWPLEVATARWALEQVGIAHKLYARTGQLSGGEQQRVALARVLVQNPRAVLADEPIASLDPARSLEILDLLRDSSRRAGKTLVASVHAIDLAQSHFGRLIGLREGRLLWDSTARHVTPAMIDALYKIERPLASEPAPARAPQ